MRTLFILLLLAITSSATFAQAIIGKMYTIVPDFVNVYGLGPDDTIIPEAKFRASSETKFTVTGFDKKNNIKLTFWRYYKKGLDSAYFTRIKSRKEVTQYDLSEAYIGHWANYKEFAMTLEDFNSACVPFYGKKTEFTWGVMTLPIKLRPGNKEKRYFSYEESLNLGFVFGFRQQIPGKVKKSWNYLFGVGIASVKTDAASLNEGAEPSGNTTAAFSANIGTLYAHNNFQIGLFMGFDNIPGEAGRDWKYQGRPWFGVAVGISLFSNNDTQGNEGKNEEH